jgi:hypothetical protein
MHSAWVSGQETLDMTPVDDPAYPLSGRVSVPRQVVETVGCILEEVVGNSQREFLGLLAGVMERHGRECFSAVYLLVFMMLHECEAISRDRYRFARENFKEVCGKLFLPLKDIPRLCRRPLVPFSLSRSNPGRAKTRFDQPEYVGRLHENANVVLSHWHEFTKAQGVDWTSRRTAEETLAFLPREDAGVILACWDAARNRSELISCHLRPDSS